MSLPTYRCAPSCLRSCPTSYRTQITLTERNKARAAAMAQRAAGAAAASGVSGGMSVVGLGAAVAASIKPATTPPKQLVEVNAVSRT